jgi:hypothetical protein
MAIAHAGRLQKPKLFDKLLSVIPSAEGAIAANFAPPGAN